MRNKRVRSRGTKPTPKGKNTVADGRWAASSHALSGPTGGEHTRLLVSNTQEPLRPASSAEVDGTQENDGVGPVIQQTFTGTGP